MVGPTADVAGGCELGLVQGHSENIGAERGLARVVFSAPPI